MDRVLVTGAGGFLGRRIVERLVNEGWSVRATDRPGVPLAYAEAPGVETVAADLMDPDAANRAAEGCDAVVHAAAIFDLAAPAERLLQVNLGTTRNVCRAASAAGARRLVQISTSGVYGVPRRTPVEEHGEKRPRNAYERSKWESEQWAVAFGRQRGMEVAALRPTLIYGPGSRYGQAMYLAIVVALRAWGWRELPLPRGGRRTHHVHADDVAGGAAAVLAAPGERVAGRAFNVGDDRPTTTEEVLTLLCKAYGLKFKPLPGAIRFVIEPLLRWAPGLLDGPLDRLNKGLDRTWERLVPGYGLEAALRPRFDAAWLDYLWADHVYDTTALRALGWRPEVPDFADGMARTIDWYQRQRWIPTPAQIEELPFRDLKHLQKEIAG